MKSDHLEMIAATAACLVVAVLWYFLWVQPNDAHLYAIMDCMGDETSRVAYEACAKSLMR